MEGELLAPRLPLTEGGHGERVPAGDGGRQPDHPRLVTHDKTASEQSNVTKYKSEVNFHLVPSLLTLPQAALDKLAEVSMKKEMEECEGSGLV